MPVEAKRLFRPDVLRSHLSGFRLPTVDTTKLDHWAREIISGQIAPSIKTAQRQQGRCEAIRQRLESP